MAKNFDHPKEMDHPFIENVTKNRAKETHCQSQGDPGSKYLYPKETVGSFPAPTESSSSHFSAAGTMDAGKIRIGLPSSCTSS